MSSNSRVIRILHFTESGDTSGYFPQLARWHDRERYRMYFGTLRPNTESLDETMRRKGVALFSCWCAGRVSYPLGLARLARYLRAEKIDVLHTHLFEPSVVGMLAGTLTRTPVRVLTRHYSDYHTRIHRTRHVRLDQLCTRLADRVIAVSQHTAQHLTFAEGAPPHKVVTIVNGVDFARLRPASPDARLRLRRELGAEDAFLIVVPARLHPEKGHPFLFRALPLVRNQSSRGLVVALAGTGPFEASYRSEVAALGCDEMVRFLGFRSDLPDLMQAADLMVLPSVAEAFGLVLAEALFVGTPIVSTTVGAIAEIVDDQVDGLLVPPGDPAALAAAIRRVLDDEGLRSKLAGAGRAKVLARFGFERMVRQYEALYDELVASPVCTGRLGNQQGRRA